MIITLKSSITTKDMNSQNYENRNITCLQHSAENDFSDFYTPVIELLAVQISEE